MRITHFSYNTHLLILFAYSDLLYAYCNGNYVKKIVFIFLLCCTGQLSLEAEKTWLQCECERWHLKYGLEGNDTLDAKNVTI